ncbi:cation:proton antiporter [Roseibium sp.]|uniref:cation:proton antiporter n=1 Tax=Roseibium sp. TaxID=1936156 RepID=UPI003A9760CC
MDHAITLVSLGLLLLVGMAADEVGHRTKLPRVTLLILCGVVAGPSGLDVLPSRLSDLYDLLSVLALSMVAFLLGGKLSRITLVNSGRIIVLVSIVVVVLTGAIVAGGFALVGLPLAPALVLAAIATATDPAATQDVIRQSGSKGHFTSVLTGIVALDDAWGLIVFALCLVGAQSLMGAGGEGHMIYALREIFGAGLLGIAVGFPAAYLTGRLRPGDPTLSEALGVVFLLAGLALWLDVSFLLSGMVCGCVLANFASHHSRAFHEIEHVEWPFMTLFFFLAGSMLDIGTLIDLGALGLGYIGLRLAGRVAGGWLGGRIAGLNDVERRWMGFSLVPQAGVALGMALIGAEALPQWRNEIMTVTIGATVVFELLGPVLTYLALTKVGDAGRC